MDESRLDKVIVMSDESHEYLVKLDWTHGRVGNLTVEGKTKIQVSAPPEFDGPEGIISPEDLFVAAATSCFMTTFVTFTKKMHIEFKSFACDGYGTLERVEKGFQFTKILLKTKVVVESEELVSKAEKAMELAGKYCLVSNSMKCPTEHENKIVVG
ncbi:MAG: OsmC family peroxiredoxin [Candidatus Thorarchaeota archaeon]|nr:MAG: OsmC family peroxiredoxin [Candidatus Thorarchaeota archaeon]